MARHDWVRCLVWLLDPFVEEIASLTWGETHLGFNRSKSARDASGDSKFVEVGLRTAGLNSVLVFMGILRMSHECRGERCVGHLFRFLCES